MAQNKRIGFIENYFPENSISNILKWNETELQLFTQEYIKEADLIEPFLQKELASLKNPFRSYLPLSRWAFHIASQVLWYYDAIVISDPVYSIVKDNGLGTDGKKQLLIDAIGNLLAFKDVIEDGYLILTTNNARLFENKELKPDAEILIDIPVIHEIFQEYTAIGGKPAFLPSGEGGLKQLMVIYEGLVMGTKTMGMYIPEEFFGSGKLSDGITYELMSPLKPISKDELTSLGKLDMLDGARNEYLRDIQIVIGALIASQQINAPALFFREIDEKVAQAWLQNHVPSKGGLSDRAMFDCALPYVQDIPPQKLLDLKNEIPAAFKEFRLLLHELYIEAKQKQLSPVEAQLFFEKKTLPLTRKLETEMSNTIRKVKLLGTGAASSLTGALLVYAQNPEFAQIIATLLGSLGIGSGLKLLSDYKSETKTAALNPMYFAWRASKT